VVPDDAISEAEHHRKIRQGRVPLRLEVSCQPFFDTFIPPSEGARNHFKAPRFGSNPHPGSRRPGTRNARGAGDPSVCINTIIRFVVRPPRSKPSRQCIGLYPAKPETVATPNPAIRPTGGLPGDAPTVGDGGRRGRAGQETVPEPAWMRQPLVTAMGQSDPLPRTPHGQWSRSRPRFCNRWGQGAETGTQLGSRNGDAAASGNRDTQQPIPAKTMGPRSARIGRRRDL